LGDMRRNAKCAQGNFRCECSGKHVAETFPPEESSFARTEPPERDKHNKSGIDIAVQRGRVEPQICRPRLNSSGRKGFIPDEETRLENYLKSRSRFVEGERLRNPEFFFHVPHHDKGVIPVYGKRFAFSVLFLVLSLFLLGGCGGGGGDGGFEDEVEKDYEDYGSLERILDYTTTEELLFTHRIIDASEPNCMQASETSLVGGYKTIIPADILPSGADVVVSEVVNPPVLLPGFFEDETITDEHLYVMYPISVKSNRRPSTGDGRIDFEIFYSDKYLKLGDIGHVEILKLAVFSEGKWRIGQINLIDSRKKVIYGSVDRFGIVALIRPALSPSDLPDGSGVRSWPEPVKGDILFRKGALEIKGAHLGDGWIPGHVGIYVGRVPFEYDGRTYNAYAVVESNPKNKEKGWDSGVLMHYYKNIENFGSSSFSGNELNRLYMGAYAPGGITDKQRGEIVDFVKGKIGSMYPLLTLQNKEMHFGMFPASQVQGPNYNCVGLAEAAMEHAGINDGKGMLGWFGVISPEKMYNAILASRASQADNLPSIEWARMEPERGPAGIDTKLLIKVGHRQGLGAIRSVAYRVKEDGYMNPEINKRINDKGLFHDERAGDGIYTGFGNVGCPLPGLMKMTLVVKVIDEYGNWVERDIVFTYTSTGSEGGKEEVVLGKTEYFHGQKN